MSDKGHVIIRNAIAEDISIVSDIDFEAFSPYGTAEKPKTFHLRLKAFSDGFVVLLHRGEIAAYGCSEKWLTEREPGLDENPIDTHYTEGKIFCITAMAVKLKYRGYGYGLAILDELIRIAKKEACNKIVLETTHAQGLYQKRGFQVLESRNERGVPLDIMSLDFGSDDRNE